MIELRFFPGRELRARATLFAGVRDEGNFSMNWFRVKILVMVLVALFLIAQFVQPKRTTARRAVTIAAGACSSASKCLGNLEQGCRRLPFQPDCMAWYSHVAPISWVVVDDVKTGRSHITFRIGRHRKIPRRLPST